MMDFDWDNHGSTMIDSWLLNGQEHEQRSGMDNERLMVNRGLIIVVINGQLISIDD